MHSYRATYGAGLEGLRLTEEQMAAPGPGEVLVEVRAAAIGFRDRLVLEGRYVLPVKDAVVPLAEGSGIVAALGPGVTDLAVGDPVVAHVFPDWLDGDFGPDRAAQLGGSLDGLLTQFAVLPRRALLPMPAHLTFAEAATLPCTALTAWNALTGGRPVHPGETVLTLGSGGVSRAAIQLAKAAGARVVATAGSPAKGAALRDLGADAVLDYHDPDWPLHVGGAHLIVEVAGTLNDSLRAVHRGGQIAFVGLLTPDVPAIDPRRLFTSGATVRPLAVGSRTQFEALLRAVDRLALRPSVDREYPFAEAPAAFADSFAGRVGKAVITQY